jgi:hypothetical protein
MHARKRLVATLAAAAAVAGAAPVAAHAQAAPATPAPSNVCLSGVSDPGPLGPSGPYGPDGPWGEKGPLHGQPNPLGDVANCGGSLAFIMRGGTVSSFVQANLQAAGY